MMLAQKLSDNGVGPKLLGHTPPCEREGIGLPGFRVCEMIDGHMLFDTLGGAAAFFLGGVIRFFHQTWYKPFALLWQVLSTIMGGGPFRMREWRLS